MTRTLLCLSLLLPLQAFALTLSDYRALRDASTRGDVMAGRLLESYLSGIAEGTLVAHAISPVPGMCIGRDKTIKPTDVIAIVAIAENMPTFKTADPARMPVAPLFLRGLKERFPCP